jgi:hypothetical protein
MDGRAIGNCWKGRQRKKKRKKEEVEVKRREREREGGSCFVLLQIIVNHMYTYICRPIFPSISIQLLMLVS